MLSLRARGGTQAILTWDLLAITGLAGVVLGMLRRSSSSVPPAPEVAVSDDTHDDAMVVLAAAPVHMLLLDASYRVVGDYSPKLAGLFRVEELRGRELPGLLRRILPAAQEASAREFLGVLFDASLNEDELESRNPLRHVEIMLAAGESSIAPRDFSFGFRRLYRDGTIERVLMWAEDRTENLQEREGRFAEAQKARKFDAVAGLLGANRGDFDEFVGAAAEQLRAIDGLLQAGDAPADAAGADLRWRIESISERVEAIERAAASIGYRHFQRRARDYRAKVDDVAGRAKLGGSDFLALVLEQSAFRAELDELREILAQLERGSAMIAPEIAAQSAYSGVAGEIASLAQRVAGLLGKEVVVDAGEFDEKPLSASRRELVRSVLEELTRNAVEHGIEEPAVRESAGKPRAGRIRIRTNGQGAGVFAFSFRDDGKGLDATRLRARAVGRSLLGSGRTGTLEDSDLAAFVFAPELSDGMPAVKRKIVDECGGSIWIDSEYGAFCEFSFVIPANED